MNVTGIVAEYNPFHFGHAYQIDMAKKQGATHVVVCMSGNFTQRGDISYFNKFTKAKAATLNGADLVLELPTPYALSSADRFAFGAMSIFHNMGCINNIHFGSECGDIEKIKQMAEIADSPKISDMTAKILKSGVSYPAAKQQAIEQIYPDISQHFLYPNNTLGIEYVKWLRRLGSDIQPQTIKRHKVVHDSKTPSGSFASASYIRSFLMNKSDEALQYVPKSAGELFKKDIEKGFIPNKSNFDVAVLSKMRTITVEELLNTADVSEGLENRILTSSAKATEFVELCRLIKTKRYTMARIRRIILNAFLGIPKYMQAEPVPYIRILAFNKRGQEVLKMAKKTSSLYVSSSLSSIRNHCSKASPYILTETKTTDIYSLCTKTIQPCSSDFLYKIRG